MATIQTSSRLLLTIIWLVNILSSIDARCGYPELPGNAHINQAPTDNWQYFEEDNLLKVECTTGLLGRLEDVSRSAEVVHYNLSTSYVIVCRNGRWNSSHLVCIKSTELSSNSVHFQDLSPTSRTHARIVQEPDNIGALTDKDASTCVPITKSSSQLSRKLLFRVDLHSTVPQQQISRIMLLLKHNSVEERPETTTISPETIDLNNLTAIEHFILDINDAVDDETETENRKFMDFVYSTEFHNLNQTRMPQFSIHQTTLNPNGSQSETWLFQLSKQYQIDDHQVLISASLGNNEIESQCSLTENAQFQQNSSQMEMLMFDCGVSALPESFGPKFFMLKVDITRTDKHGKGNSLSRTGALLNICGLESFELAQENCNKPYIPIYGTIKQIENNDKVTVAEYGCKEGYFLVNTSQSQIDEAYEKPNSTQIRRSCDRSSGRWSPSSVESLMCQPKVWCRAPPPMPGNSGGSFRFFFEFTKLDYLRRAVGGHALATLRCQTVTELVMPITIYACNTRGEWILLGGNVPNRTEPECRVSSSYRSSSGRRYRTRHHYHHYYHLLSQQKANHTNTHLFGRSLNDNKSLIYVGVIGLVLLFGGSFIVLFHVRRMAKKISRQMRERSYIGISNNEGSMVIGGMMDKNGYNDQFTDPLCREQDLDYNCDADLDESNGYPPYYSQSNRGSGRNNGASNMSSASNYYDMNVAFSTDLPPPATPISMPATVLERKANSGDSTSKRYKNGLNLAANFDNVKF